MKKFFAALTMMFITVPVLGEYSDYPNQESCKAMTALYDAMYAYPDHKQYVQAGVGIPFDDMYDYIMDVLNNNIHLDAPTRGVDFVYNMFFEISGTATMRRRVEQWGEDIIHYRGRFRQESAFFPTFCGCETGQYVPEITAPGDFITCDDCAPGYYGTSGTCTRCPSPGTSPAGAKTITKCYIPANAEQTEDIGTYVFTTDCNYTN